MNLPRKLLVPELLPGCCSRCRSGPGENREHFIDLGFQTFDEPGVYLCNVCMDDVIQADQRYMKLTHYDDAMASMKSRMDEADKTMEYSKNLLEKLRGFLDGRDDAVIDSSLSADERAIDDDVVSSTTIFGSEIRF